MGGLEFAFGYLHDIFILSPDKETHLKYMEFLFDRLSEVNLKLGV